MFFFFPLRSSIDSRYRAHSVHLWITLNTTHSFSAHFFIGEIIPSLPPISAIWTRCFGSDLLMYRWRIAHDCPPPPPPFLLTIDRLGVLLWIESAYGHWFDLHKVDFARTKSTMGIANCRDLTWYSKLHGEKESEEVNSEPVKGQLSGCTTVQDKHYGINKKNLR